MHIPFSMSDEPDLGDEFKGHYDNEFLTEPEPWMEKPRLYTQEDMDKVIQQSLSAQRQAFWDGYDHGKEERNQ
jgi:hypothetical protein